MNSLPKRYGEIEVCGATVLVAEGEDGKCYVSPRHICQGLGISWGSQRDKILADPVLATSVLEISTQLPGTSQTRAYLMLPIEFLSGWLFAIKKVRPEIQAKLNLFRAEAFLALDAWFRQGLRSDPEVQAKFQVPQTLADALELAAKKVRENERLEAENKVMAPKAEKHDRFMSSESLLRLTDAAKLLTMSGPKLGEMLRQKGWLFKTTKHVLPTNDAIKKGYMVTKEVECPDGKFRPMGYLTPMGMDMLAGVHG